MRIAEFKNLVFIQEMISESTIKYLILIGISALFISIAARGIIRNLKRDSVKKNNHINVQPTTQTNKVEVQKLIVKPRARLQGNGNKEFSEGQQLTIDGWDPAVGDIIDPIFLWQYSDAEKNDTMPNPIVGKMKHGEKVKLIRREGERVAIETRSGLRGWVTYFLLRNSMKKL